MLKKLFSLLAALTLCTGLWALDNVKYMDANGQEQTVNNVTEITSSSAALNAGWYVVNGTDVKTGTLVCKGEVHLILADGAKLTSTGSSSNPGIQVSGEGNSLAVYGQSAQSGQLIATGGNYSAGIGSNRNQDGSNITINGGIVTATGGGSAAGIGGGNRHNGSNITINGGIITTIGGYKAAGIGGGETGSGSNIIINGGIVTATGGGSAAGIGGGNRGNGSNIIIHSGTVTAAGVQATGIGNGTAAANPASNIFVDACFVVKADGNNPPATVIAKDRTDTTDIASDFAAKQYATITPKGNLTIEDIVISDTSATYNGEIQSAMVTVKESIIGAGNITVTYRQDSVEVATPVNAGLYDIYAAVAEGYLYNAFDTVKVGTLTIAKAMPSAANFVYIAPEDSIWDGNAKIAKVTFDDRDGKLSGMGEITIVYLKDAIATLPVEMGNYTVAIDITEGGNFTSAENLNSRSWTFTIVAPKPVPTGDGQLKEDNHNSGKFILNGHLVIVKDGKAYNAQGIKVQ